MRPEDDILHTLPAPFPEEEPDEEGTSVYEHHRLRVDGGQSPMRIDKYLMEHLTNTSRNRLQQAAAQEFILLDRPKYDNDIIPEDIPLDIVYEDRDLMVVDKPAGLVVHPGCGNYTGTLVNAIAWHLKDDPTYDPNDPTVGLVHRIDKDTSGLLVIAKNADAKTHLGRQFFNKTTRRLYNALVWGGFDTPAGRIEGNIGRHPKDRMQMAVFPPDSGIGKPAVTHYRVLEDFGYVSLVECRLETGRTHQIRAHMKHIGHPLFNDARYGGDEVLRGTQSGRYKQFIQNGFAICPRQALHARTLGFTHPRTGEEMYFNSEIPADMEALLTRWRTYTAHRDTDTDV